MCLTGKLASVWRSQRQRMLLAPIILTAVCAPAQDLAAIKAAQSACGPANIKFDAKQDASQHPTPQPEAGKALVYVAQEIGELKCSRCALTRIGMDGAWVGANQGSSYFSFAAEPGDHHVCLNWQSVLSARSRAYAFVSFRAEAGKVYYLRARIFPGNYDYSFDLEPMDPDQGKYVVASSEFSLSHPKK
jgi:hypothetical protein